MTVYNTNDFLQLENHLFIPISQRIEDLKLLHLVMAKGEVGKNVETITTIPVILLKLDASQIEVNEACQ